VGPINAQTPRGPQRAPQHRKDRSMSQTRESRLQTAADRAAGLMVEAARAHPGEWQEIDIQPPCGAVKYTDAEGGGGVYTMITNDGETWRDFSEAQAATQALQDDFRAYYEGQSGARFVFEKA